MTAFTLPRGWMFTGEYYTSAHWYFSGFTKSSIWEYWK